PNRSVIIDVKLRKDYVNADRTVRSQRDGLNKKRKNQMTAIVREREPASADPADGAKRLQIINGARSVFLAQGFDGASMGEIARTAGVSKGTLYVYFTSKEELFQVVAHAECFAQAEQVFALDHADHDVEAALTRLGTAFVGFLCQPQRMAAVRTIM